jgi:hypothetical protein
MLGVHVDSDGVLIDDKEEYGSLCLHSSKDNVDFDGVLESMSKF